MVGLVCAWFSLDMEDSWVVVAFGFGWVSSTIIYIHINLRGAGLGDYTRAPRFRVFRRWISALFGARVGFDPILPCLSLGQIQAYFEGARDTVLQISARQPFASERAT